MGDGKTGYLGHHLRDQGLAKRGMILRHHHEGAGPADDFFAVISFKTISRINRTVLPYERLIFGNDECIDCNPLSEHLVAHKRYVAAGIVVIAIAGHVDDAALRVKQRALDLAHREINPAADRRMAEEGAWRLIELAGKSVRAGRVLNHGPVDQNLLIAQTGPFNVADRNAPKPGLTESLRSPGGS